MLLAGGGSGGHIFPALAVAEVLAARGWQVSYAGRSTGMEADLVTARGLPFYGLPARPVVGQGALGKALAVATLLRGALAARHLVRRLGVRTVVGTGGYVAAPAVLGARLARRPVLLVEPNAEAGVANRLLSRWATEATVAYPDAAARLRCPAVVTGIPVRRAFFDVPAALPAAAPRRLLVLGGSQGAQQLNRLLPAALEHLGADIPALAVCHQAGAQHAQEVAAAYTRRRAAGGLAGLEVEVVPFLDDVAAALGSSHLVVSRAGAITLAEICAAGRPSLLVPLRLAGGHQAANAQALQAAGAAEMLAGDEVTAIALATRLAALLGDGARLNAMASAARHLGNAGAAVAIADRVEHLGRAR